MPNTTTSSRGLDNGFTVVFIVKWDLNIFVIFRKSGAPLWGINLSDVNIFEDKNPRLLQIVPTFIII